MDSFSSFQEVIGRMITEIKTGGQREREMHGETICFVDETKIKWLMVVNLIHTGLSHVQSRRGERRWRIRWKSTKFSTDIVSFYAYYIDVGFRRHNSRC